MWKRVSKARISGLGAVLLATACGSAQGGDGMTSGKEVDPDKGSMVPGGSTVTGDMPADQTVGVDPVGMDLTGAEHGGEPALALDECGLATGFTGDEVCILPPPPDQGFQVHVGPIDYDNPLADYVLLPGEERTDDFPAVSGNEVDVFFYHRQYRMRPTAHHMILTTGGGGLGLGRRIGTANANQDFPAGGVIAPENQGVGSPLAARSDINVSLHAINVGDSPQLREIWVNFWYRDPAEVVEPAEQIFKMGDITFSVQPYEETMLGPYTCDIPEEGRMLWFYGHRHANNVRFSAWRVRNGQRDLIYEGYDWEEPLLLQYNSVVENPVPDPATGVEGGWSGILDLLPGDQIQWECHVINQNDVPIGFSNQTYLGEMCIVDAETVGTPCNGF